jgi:hypothetical protein
LLESSGWVGDQMAYCQQPREVHMVGVGGTSPRTKPERLVWWTVFSIFMGAIIYVLIKNRHNF